jgi:hypothetical protein
MLEPAETSYFSKPSAGLDPRLFRDGKLTPQVRNAILQLLNNYLDSHYSGGSTWSRAWLAGSGVSYQWAAHRDPGDLDCLVGVDFVKFRQSNVRFTGLSDKEIADMLNEGFRAELQPDTSLFMGSFELTFYVNIHSNIIDIKPYAAYSLTDDDWTVPPVASDAPTNPQWEERVNKDRSLAIDLMTRYTAAKNLYNSASNDAVKTNARSQMRIAMSQGNALYESIHSERSNAFSPTGEGYSDFYNYRWQAGKRSGVIQFLRALKTDLESLDAEYNKRAYGSAEFPDTSTLIRRAASQHR